MRGCWRMVRLARLLTTKAAARALLVLALGVIGVVALATIAGAAEPQPWELGFQPPATPVKDRLSTFHDELLIIIALITAFVLGLLVYVMWRFNHRRNPVPSHTSHNTVIEM